MRKTKKILSLALASTMVLSLAACGGGSTSTPTTAAETTTAAPADADTTGETTAAEAESEGAEGETTSNGNNIAVCLASEPQTVDPALNSAVDGAIMINHFFEGLVKWVDDGEGNAMTAPGQAESW